MTVADEAWRLFIAVPIADDVRVTLAAALEPVRVGARGGRWQSPETWHLTLRFLGDTRPDDVPGIRDALKDVAAAQAPFAAALGRAGAFERRAGRVAWVGLEGGITRSPPSPGRLTPDSPRQISRGSRFECT